MTRFLAGIVGLLLIADLVGIATVSDNDDPPARMAASSSTSMVGTSPAVGQTTTVGADPLQALVAELQPFVAEHRGLKFTHALKVTLLPEAQFRARVLALAKEDDAELVRTGNELRALGLIKPGVDLVKARDELLGAAIVGFYDPETDELVVRGARLTPYLRTTLVHEITHALEDQNFDIDRPEYEKAEDEASIGFSALAEGDALRVEEAYRSSMSRRDREDAAAEERKAASRIDPKDIPLILSQLLVFPYTEGPLLVSALLKAGGQARLDAAFRKPPTTTEQVMHPDKFLAGEAPKPVADPAADAATIDKGVMGELLLKLVLATVLPAATAARTAAGWGGDRYVAWTQGEQTCIRVAYVMDTAADLQELRSGLTQWASRQKAASVSPNVPVTLTTCA